MVMACTLVWKNERNRRIYVYDTFEGMPLPTEEDFELSRKTSALSMWREKWDFAPLGEVRKNVLSTGFPESNIIFVKGKVEETIPNTMPSKIALLRLDTDWYGSTNHELAHLFPLLEPNGVLIIDDYGHWGGSKKATDEYLSINQVPMFLNRIDYTGRIGIK